jgi:hypothetical protein
MDEMRKAIRKEVRIGVRNEVREKSISQNKS